MSTPVEVLAGQGATIPLPQAPVLPSEVGDWLALLKPRVITLVVFTGAVGLLVAPGHLHPVLAFAAILSIAVAAGASGAINMWYDRDIDAIMRRTRKRPIPAGRISAAGALGFGVVLAVSSVVLMFLATNVAAAAVLALSIGFYVFIYTMWLKRLTPQNIVIGGAAGAFPPVIGWAAVTGSIDVLPVMLFAIVFFWTPPTSGPCRSMPIRLRACQRPHAPRCARCPHHPLACARLHPPPGRQFRAPMARRPHRRIYGVSALVLGAGFILCAARVMLDRQDALGRSLTNDTPARQAFKYSLPTSSSSSALLPWTIGPDDPRR